LLYANTDTHPYWNSNCNSYSDSATTYTNANSATTDSYTNTHSSSTNSYSNTNRHRDADTSIRGRQL